MEKHVYICIFLILHIIPSSHGTKLLTILVDGLKWNYFDKFSSGELRGFDRVIKSGVKAEHLLSDYPSSSYINYYSLMTGLHPESHGMLDNYMFDPEHNTSFLIGTNPEQYESYWWDDGDPLWITATRQGKGCYMWYWPGCEVQIRGLRPDYCASYFDNAKPGLDKFKVAVDEAIELYKDGSADYAGIYYETLDITGHIYGPDSPEMVAAIRDLDTGIDYLLDKLDSASLTDQVDIMIFSDHGMQGFDCKNMTKCNVIISDLISKDDLEIYLDSRSFYPKVGSEEKVYNALKSHPGLHVWRREEIPDYFHWKNHRRAPPIRVTARKGWLLSWESVSNNLGDHGYLPWEIDMWGVFLATGQVFKVGFSKSGLSNIELYQVMCHVMGISPSPHNGTWDHVADMFLDPSPNIALSLTANPLGLLFFLELFLITCHVFCIMQ